MKGFTTIIAAAALVSTSFAATVKIEETPCLQNNTKLESFDIEIGKLVVKELPSVCGLKIVSATDADVNAIECQAFKDAAGQNVGSAKFTSIKPALIATNPVQEGSILCTIISSSAVSSSLGTVVKTGTSAPSASGTGVPSTTANSTAPSATGTPTQPANTAAPSQTGAAGRVGMSIGALAVGVAALVL